MVIKEMIELTQPELIYLCDYYFETGNPYITAKKILKDGQVDLYLKIISLELKLSYHLKISTNSRILHVEYKQNKRK